MLHLAQLIQSEVEDGGLVEQAIFGTADPELISRLIGDSVRSVLGIGVISGLFYRSSVGCVAGLSCADGRRLVFKAHQPNRSYDFLEVVAQVQRDLAGRGFPCPTPLAKPVRIGTELGHASFESWLDDPGQPPITRAMLQVSAHGLAHSAQLTVMEAPSPIVFGTERGDTASLYPSPHSPIFDFESTRAGAEWINAIAEEAIAICRADDSPPIVMHGDWSAGNVRLSHTDVLAVYDWDSLISAPISRPVGVAAATCSARGEPGEPAAPDAEEISLYVREFENAWGQLGTLQRQAAHANALYCLAYTARCEHALDPMGETHMRARARLRSDGTSLLRGRAGRP